MFTLYENCTLVAIYLLQYMHDVLRSEEKQYNRKESRLLSRIKGEDLS